ncbi:hypothetical protein GCM10018779_59110 [Streptomyces griseocarneus]|nr:hypothetical protein GCM10018779_59110 [Streptomyces griseocarneus]
MRGATSGDLRSDSPAAQESTVLVEVVSAVGEQPPRAVEGTATQAPDAGNSIKQRYQLGDVMPVPAGQ